MNNQDKKWHQPNKSKEIKFTTHQQSSHAPILFCLTIYIVYII